MGAIEILTNDHNKVRELFRQFNGGGLTGRVRRTIGDVSAAEPGKAVDRVSKELETHTRIEEEVFYPSVGRRTPGSWKSRASPSSCVRSAARSSSAAS